MGVGQSMETLLNVENLGVNYGSVQALHNATFRLGAGSICGLIGMNGSGKSTLFKAIMGVTPAHTGSVEIAGGDPAVARKSGVVSYVPQSEEIDWSFPVSVRDVVAMGRYRTLGPTRRLHSKDKQALAHALERLELTDLAARQIGALSGGQRKRATILRRFTPSLMRRCCCVKLCSCTAPPRRYLPQKTWCRRLVCTLIPGTARPHQRKTQRTIPTSR